MDNIDQPFTAPGFDANLHDCQSCLDTGINQDGGEYCTACRMGKRIEQLDQFAEQLKGHGFTEAMRIVYRTTQRTEKAIAAADKALMMAQMAKPQWKSMQTAPKDKPIWAFNGEQGIMHWTEGESWALWVWTDELLSDADPSPDQPTHWMELPSPPVSKQG